MKQVMLKRYDSRKSHHKRVWFSVVTKMKIKWLHLSYVVQQPQCLMISKEPLKMEQIQLKLFAGTVEFYQEHELPNFIKQKNSRLF